MSDEQQPVEMPAGFTLRHVLRGHEKNLISAAWSPDGQTLASCSGDKTVQLWDAGSGKLRHTLTGHENDVFNIAWSPDGQILACVTINGTVQLWDSRTGTLRRTLTDLDNIAYRMLWSPDGQILASGSEDATVRLWDTHTGDLIHALTGHDGDVFDIAWSPDGQILASGSGDATVRLWDTHTGEIVRILAGHDGDVNSVAWSPDGKILTSGSVDTTLRFWDVTTGDLIHTLTGHDAALISVVWSPEGRILLSIQADDLEEQGKYIIWKSDTWEKVAQFTAQPLTFTSFYFSSLGLLATGSNDSSSRNIRIWELDLTVLLGLERLDLDFGSHAVAGMHAFNQAVVFEPELPLRAFLQRRPARAPEPIPQGWLSRQLKAFWVRPAELGLAGVDALAADQPRVWPGLDRWIDAHRQSAATARVYPPAASWSRALAWWRAAAELAPALPLGLAADLGVLLVGEPRTENREPRTDDAYGAFVRAAAATPAMRAAQSLGLSDVAVAALLAHLSQGAPVPPEYRIPAGMRPVDLAATLAQALALSTTPISDSSFILHPSSLLDHLLTRLRALSPADVRFVAELGQGALGVADLADLRALTELLSLPALSQSLIDEVLAFLPALAEAAPGAALQTYAVDGYGGLARSGSLDAVLPSEWALPGRLRTYRYLNGELLYYGRERPPERRNTLLLLLVQQSDAMAGDLEPLVKASALALARAGQARGATVLVAPFNTRLHPLQGLARPSEVATLVRWPCQGRVDMARVLGQVAAQVRVHARHYARVELCWLLHAQTGADHAATLGALARRLRGQAGSRALFVSAGAAVEQPALAGLLAGRWASVGSAALHEAEERAKAARALRGLAKPSEREQLAVEPPPQQRRRVVAVEPTSAPDLAITLLKADRWEEALAALAPRARAGDEMAKALLAIIVEGFDLLSNRSTPVSTVSVPDRPPVSRLPSLGMELLPPVSILMAWEFGNESPLSSLPPLPFRLQAAAILSEIGDPRLLDPQRGDSSFGGYWCPVDAGPFWFGDDRGEELRQVMLPYAYRIGRYPVTNAEYRRFIEAGGYQERRWWTEHGWAYLQPGGYHEPGEPERITLPRYWHDARYNQPTQPMVGVSWYEATAYCVWLTAQGYAVGWLPEGDTIRLPTSLEWERAARGVDQRRYPWGDEAPDAERANYKETGIKQPTAVGCFPGGAAACGVLDMAGNCTEWMNTPTDKRNQLAPKKEFVPSELALVSRSAYLSQSERLRCGTRFGYNPNLRYYYWSFRIVWSRSRLQ